MRLSQNNLSSAPVMTLWWCFLVPPDLGYSCCDSKVATRPLVYPTCTVGAVGDVSVARFGNLEIYEGDVSTGIQDDGDGVLNRLCFAVFHRKIFFHQRNGMSTIMLENGRVRYTLASSFL
jgi:hypothetical protein